MVKPFRFYIGLYLILGTIWAIDLSLRPYLLKIMLDKIPLLNAQNAIEQLSLPAFFYLFMGLIVTLVFRGLDYTWIQLNPPLKRHVAAQLMERMMHHSQALFQNQFAGNLGNKIKDVASGIPDLIKLIMAQFISHFLALLIAICTVWTVDFKFSLSLCIWVVVFIGGTFIFSKKGKTLSQKAAGERSYVVGSIVDILSNIMNVQLFSGATFESGRLKNSLNKWVEADQKRDYFFLKLFAFQGFSFVLYQAICIFWLIYGLTKEQISTGDFSLILTINIFIVDCLWSLSRDMSAFADSYGNIMQGLEVALSDVEITDLPNAASLHVQKGEIFFDQVKFHYKGRTALFQNKSVLIKSGQKVGLVGYSGSGKSTFVNLILRLYEIQEGRILIDHQDIQNVTQNSLRDAIGMIPQDPSLFHRSLMENIRYGDLQASDEEVIKAAKRAHAHAFITELPNGYHSLVGERGIKLSGGQRQRIAIARAILKNAPILILDEATSQLDSMTENDIQETLWELMQNKTTIIIAHRLSTLLKMDRILVFDQGHIAEDGSHTELLAKGGLYKTLWDAQVGGFLPDTR